MNENKNSQNQDITNIKQSLNQALDANSEFIKLIRLHERLGHPG